MRIGKITLNGQGNYGNKLQNYALQYVLLKYADEVYVATMDGSLGTKGTVIDAINENHIKQEYVLSCGPLPMLKAVNSKYTKGCISLEARMACGLGACMGCVVKDTEGNSLRVCQSAFWRIGTRSQRVASLLSDAVGETFYQPRLLLLHSPSVRWENTCPIFTHPHQLQQ